MTLSKWQKVADRGTSGDQVHNILMDWQKDQTAWRDCARRLEIFASAYRTHHLRNPADKLDDALAEFQRLCNTPPS